MELSIGIDLGSSKCVVAVVGGQGERGKVLCNALGEYETPSLIADRGNGRIVVGRPAAAQRHQGAITFGMRHFELDEPFRLNNDSSISVENAASYLLKELKNTAEQELGETVQRAAIAIPCCLTTKAIQKLRNAATLAGLKTVQFVPEPVATALAVPDEDDRSHRHILVYDLGSDKFDATLVEALDGRLRVLRSIGDREIGGNKFDLRLTNWLWEHLRADGANLPEAPVEPSDELIFLQLLRHAERAKRELSTDVRANILAPVLGRDHTGRELYLDVQIERAQFEQMITPDVERTLELCQQIRHDMHLSCDDIEDRLLTGGSSRIPLVRQKFNETVGPESHRIDPSHSVALGAAYFASLTQQETHSGSDAAMRRVYVPTLSHPIQLAIESELQEIVPAGAELPVEKSFTVVISNRQKICLEICYGGWSQGFFAFEAPPSLPLQAVNDLTIFVDSDSQVSAQIYFPTLNLRMAVPLSPTALKVEAAQGASQPSQSSVGNILGPHDVGTTSRAGSPQMPGMVDSVHFSVTSPTCVQPAASFILDVWAHVEQQRQHVLTRAKEAYGIRDILLQSKGPVVVTRGTVLTVRLKMDGFVIEEPEDTILWVGEIGNARFRIDVPQTVTATLCSGMATIYANGLRIAKLVFAIPIGEKMSATEAIPHHLDRHRRAFASYATQDRDEVLGRVQGMQKALHNLEVFLDVLNLRSGQNWEQELYREISQCDVFYLFWSGHARNSEWVGREWRCALDRRGIDFIDPVPLADPKVVPPPPELASKHFNDWVLAFMKRG